MDILIENKRLMRFKNKVGIITGSSRGIGKATAIKLASEGYDLVLCGRNAEVLSSLKSELSSLCQVFTLTFDVRNQVAVEAAIESLDDDWRNIDVLVNNASSFYPTPVGDITEEHWTSLVGSNVKGPLFLSQALTPALKKSKGCIVNMVDMHIDRPLPKHSVYLLAKSGLASLTQSLAIDLAPNIRVNGIGPGAILWPEREMEDAEKDTLLSSIPLGELGTPDDIANTLWFLISAPYITGQIIFVDGGRSLHTGASA